jgi:hypothetical protein
MGLYEILRKKEVSELFNYNSKLFESIISLLLYTPEEEEEEIVE